mgnify:CR=1 FL=1
MNMKRFLIVLVLMLIVSSSLFATSVVPDSVGGNPKCGGIKIDPPISTVVTLECGAKVTITLSIDGKYLDWSSDVPLAGTVIMKGGPSAFLYNYTTPTSGDVGLRCPLNLGGNIPQISHYEFCMICTPTGKFTVSIKDDHWLGQKTFAWADYKTGSQDEGCPGTYQAKGQVVIDTTAGQSILKYDVSGQVVVTRECSGEYPPMAFVVYDSLFAKINGVWQLLGQMTFNGMTIACGQTWSDNFGYQFNYQIGMTKLKKVDVAYYGEGQSVRFEQEYDLPAPVVENGYIQVYHRWEGQSEETLLGQVCYTDQLPKMFDVDSTVTYDQPGEYSFKNYFRTSDGQSGEAMHSFIIKECPDEKEVELFKVWLLNDQEGVPPSDVPENFRIVATSDIDQLIYSKIAGILAWRDAQGNLRNKLKYINASTINVIEENQPVGWVNSGGLGQIVLLNGEHFVYNSKEFTECDPDDFNVLSVFKKDNQLVINTTLDLYLPVAPNTGDYKLTFNSDGTFTSQYVGENQGDYIHGQTRSTADWYNRWGGSGNLVVKALPCWENDKDHRPTRPVVFDFTAPEGMLFVINSKNRYTRMIRFAVGVPGFDSEGHVNIIPNYPEWYTDWVFELIDIFNQQKDQIPIPSGDACDAVQDIKSDSLVFISGSPCNSEQNWTNAVDGDLEGWDGTATVKPKGDQTEDAWAIFEFADQGTYQFDYVIIQTDNGTADDKVKNRQAEYVDVLVSQTDTSASSFVLAKNIWVKNPEMTWYNLGQMFQAKYIKLVIVDPKFGRGGWRQIVEFGVSTKDKTGAVPVSEELMLTEVLPDQFKLNQNYPNPFNAETTIEYALPQESLVRLAVYDLMGRQVATLANGQQQPGMHRVVWDATGMPSGQYICELIAGEFKSVKRLILLK